MQDTVKTLDQVLTMPPETVVDPVCGMAIDPMAAVASRSINGQTVYLCSDQCMEQFDREPQRYLETEGVVTQPIAQSATTGFNSELAGPLRVELPIAGLTCATCATTVERTLDALPGIAQVHVNYALGGHTLPMIRNGWRSTRWWKPSSRRAIRSVPTRCRSASRTCTVLHVCALSRKP